MKWHLIDSGRLPPEQIMAKDALLLQQLQNNPHPILHFYDWEGDCLTYGYFTNPENYLDLSAVKQYRINMARRPTGGGIIFHLTDFAFSVLIPASHPDFSFNSLDNYGFINCQISQAILHLTEKRVQANLWMVDGCPEPCRSKFCMSQPTQYDLVVQGRKVGGAAQRKTKWGFLHQGSLSLTLPPMSLLKKIVKEKSILDSMQKNTYELLGNGISGGELFQARCEIKEAIMKIFIG